MAERAKKEPLTEEEKLAREKERIRKLQQTRVEDSGVHYRPGDLDLRDHDPLLEALIKEHPEKDPAKIK